MQRVLALGVAEHVVVATDSEDIQQVVLHAGGECVLTSADHPSGTDRVAEVIGRDAYRSFDAVVNVQGDEPFLPGAAVRGALAQIERGFPLGTAAVRAHPDVLERPDVVKVVTADDGAAMYFSRAPIPCLRDASDAGEQVALVRQHLGVYAYTPDALRQWVSLPVHALERVERLEQLRPLAAGLRMGVALVDAPGPGGIDTQDDLDRANAEWQTFTMSGA